MTRSSRHQFTSTHQRLAFLAIGLASASAALAAPSITMIPPTPGDNSSQGRSISYDGTVAAGYSASPGQEMVRYVGGVSTGLGGLPNYFGSQSIGISGDGSTIVGLSTSNGGATVTPVRWTSGTGVQEMTGLAGATKTNMTGNNYDGTVSVGYSYYEQVPDWNSYYRAVRWVGDTPQDLGTLPSYTGAIANAVSDDGNTVTGFSNNNSYGQGRMAMRWTLGGGMQSLNPGSGWQETQGVAISGDGSVIAGYGTAIGVGYYVPFVWTAGGGVQMLTGLPPSSYYATQLFPNGISGDGGTVVGTDYYSFRAWMWTAALGYKDLNQYLPSIGVDLTGWTLTEAYDANGDGTVLVGAGMYNGQARGWIITLPEPSSVLMLAMGGLAILRRRGQR